MQEVLLITKDGEFIWHPDADRLIEEGDYSNSPAMQHILRALRAKQEQGEPVAYVETKEVHGQMCSFIYRADSTKLLPDGTKLYTTPQQRTWVGLTDGDEIDWEEGGSLRDLVKAIEAKLKEKNNG